MNLRILSYMATVDGSQWLKIVVGQNHIRSLCCLGSGNPTPHRYAFNAGASFTCHRSSSHHMVSAFQCLYNGV